MESPPLAGGFFHLTMLTLTELCYTPRGLGPLSLKLEGGQIVLLCGPSGSGKSTLCGLLGEDLEPSSGELRKDARVAIMTADVESQLLGMTVGQELEIGRRAGDRKGGASRLGSQQEALVRRWRGREGEDPQSLSSGEQHLLLLTSLALSCSPVLVLDEGLSCLDEVSFTEVCALLKALAKEGALVLLVSHELRALSWVDRYLVLSEGRLLLDKPAATVTGADLKLARIWTGTLSISDDEVVLGRSPSEPSPAPLPVWSPATEAPIPLLHHRDGCDVGLSGGHALAVTGVTGSGKSLLMSTLAGQAEMEGWTLAGPSEYRVLLPQPASSVLWHRSVKAELQASLAEGRRRKVRAGPTVDDLPELPRSWLERSPRSLSQGQAKMVACLCLLMQGAEGLLMDEPFRGLDADLRQALEGRIRNYLKSGGRLVLTTHRVDEMVLYSHAMLVLRGGAPAYFGDAGAYFQNHRDSELGQLIR